MTRLVLSMLVALLSTSGAALAGEGAFCESMCDSQLRECRAGAQARPLAERVMATTPEQRNPLARTVQAAVPGQATRALDAQGDNGRKMARLDACDSARQRCTRGCATGPATQQRSPLRQPPQPAAGLDASQAG